ncbi:hypothetical protein LF817_13610 [Halobacillus sp. A1]|uniref:hypothetical protein n=1 Tax=Halobacillus sp. A1 TaxID=2880262 RepID=UPI0020A65F33|nr:hypothetical protein [Halobacillus sp. A1]MCP3032377.1 hypothetical protein [Halobacillus sp. A1]
MEVRLLDKDYKKMESLYQDFLNGTLQDKEEYFSSETAYIRAIPDFPIYIGKGSEEEKRQAFLEAFRVVSQSYLDTRREHLLDERFWHSLLVAQKQNYILTKYPEVANGENTFRNIVLKKLDWENYIYKVILGAQYIKDNIESHEERERYYELVIENLDLYNYMIKYEIFRNENFLLNILSIIDELQLSKVLKAKIKGREDLGDDERVGRRVIFEFNKSYPIIMSPILNKEELKKLFLEYLGEYYDVSQLSHDEQSSFGEVAAVVQTSSLSEGDVPPRTLEDHLAESGAYPSVDEDEHVELSDDWLLAYLNKQQFEYVDHRDKGGMLWVIGGKSLEWYLEPLQDRGLKVKFRPIGGKASKNKPAWMLYT